MNTLLINNLYVSERTENHDTNFYYLIDNVYYYANGLTRVDLIFLSEPERAPDFNIDLDGSEIIVLETTDSEYIYYQQSSNGDFVELKERSIGYPVHYIGINTLSVPLPGGRIINQTYQDVRGNTRTSVKHESISLREIDDDVIERIDKYFRPIGSPESYDQILNVLNGRNFDETPIIEKSLEQLSYETYIKQLSGIKVELPEYLIINGLRVNFIPFAEVRNIQIERYTIDPILQPWAYGAENISITPSKIITIFDKNGLTYLVKARYDPITQQIFAP